jgi:DNA-directed RNA polymerase specialized sigma24 family protein
MLNLTPVTIEREDVFIARYDRLLAWSLQMTERDRALAEDLLHDLFIQFTLNEPDLEQIANLDGYLYTMLRNLHLAQRRRDTRNRLEQLSIVEYDSAEIGLRTIDLRDQIQAQEQLRQVCQYACVRKDTAKIASVLILRFFHGYYPEEIVRVIRGPRHSIDNWLLLARNEAKASLGNTAAPGFIGANRIPAVLPTGYARGLDAFLEELRHTIFLSCASDCLDEEELKRIYLDTRRVPIECSRLAHIVSCQRCIDRVNALVGLPPLAERSATEMLGRDKRKRGGGGSAGGNDGGGGGLTSQTLGNLKRRVRDTFVHEPQELCVSVNGYALGSQRVASERSELNLIVDPDERVSFVEVFSEQKIRLLMLGIDELPPDGPGERTSQVRLSDQRLLQLTLRFSSPSPTIQVVYVDPCYAKPLDNGEAEEITAQASQSQDDGPAVRSTLSSASVSSSLSSANGNEQEPVTSRRYLSPALTRIWKALRSGSFWLRPQTVTAVFALLLLAGAAYLGLRQTGSELSAQALLARAVSAEQAVAARTDLVLHRTINLEERHAGGDVISRQRIEIWQSAKNGITARRVYGEDGRLIAGEWIRPDGSRDVYWNHALKSPKQSSRSIGNAESAIDNLNVWQLSPSASDFLALTAQKTTSVEERNGVYAVKFENFSSQTAPQQLIKASLMLSKVDLHATELIFVVTTGERQLIEYRFTESAFERRAPDSVAPSVFEPDPELLVTSKPSLPNPSSAKADTTTTLQPSRPTYALATAELEVEVLRLLNQANADTGEQINVTRTPDGPLKVHGIVDSEKRKGELLLALSTLSNNPAVLIEINTVEEVLQRQAQKETRVNEISIERAAPSAKALAIDTDLRRFLSQRGMSGEQLDREVMRFANRTLGRSRSALFRALALKRLAQRFSPEELRTLTPDARTKWLALLREHARAFRTETASLRQELQAIFNGGFNAGSTGRASPAAITNDEGLIKAAAELASLAQQYDEAIQSAFTLSTGTDGVSTVRSPQFWRWLSNAESLAVQIESINQL